MKYALSPGPSFLSTVQSRQPQSSNRSSTQPPFPASHDHNSPASYPAYGGPQALVSSPLVGCSILMISALQQSQISIIVNTNTLPLHLSALPIPWFSTTTTSTTKGWMNERTPNPPTSAYNKATPRQHTFVSTHTTHSQTTTPWSEAERKTYPSQHPRHIQHPHTIQRALTLALRCRRSKPSPPPHHYFPKAIRRRRRPWRGNRQRCKGEGSAWRHVLLPGPPLCLCVCVSLSCVCISPHLTL